MQTPEIIVRSYRVQDAKLLEDARIVCGIFKQDYTDLVEFDPTLADPFIDNYLVQITDAEQVDPDSLVLDQQTQMTVEVDTAMKKGRNTYQALKYFIERAFPKSPTIWNEFGYNDYTKVQASHAHFIQFYIQLYKTAVKYAVQLDKVGYDATRIAKLNDISQSLQNGNTTQEMFKNTRPVSTQERIVALNGIWDTLSRIRRAGKLTYIENFAKQKRYYGVSNTATKPITEGSVPANAVSNVRNNDFTADTMLTLKNTGGTALRFGLCQSATEVPAETGIIVDSQTEQTISVAQLGDFDNTYTFINVVNLSTKAAGSYQLTILE